MSSLVLEEQLKKAALDTRRAFMTCGEYGSNLKGLCQLAARVLGMYLIQDMKLGPVEIVCNGTRYLPYRSYDIGRPLEQSYAWLEVGGFIIDISADQFDDFDVQVVVTEDRSWYDGFKGQTRHAEDDIVVGSTDFVRDEYRKLLPIIRGER